MKFKSLSIKLSLIYLLILGIMIILAGIFLYQSFKDSMVTDLDKKLHQIAFHTYNVWESKWGVTWQDAMFKTQERYEALQPYLLVGEIKKIKQKPANLRFFSINNIFIDSIKLDKEVYIRAATKGQANPTITIITNTSFSSYPIRTLLYPVEGVRKEKLVIQVGLSMETAINATRRLFFILILAGILLLLLAGLGGGFFIRRALAPVVSVAHTAQKITADELSTRIKSRGRKDEIGLLVDTFNQMIDRLEVSIKKIRQFSADVSHELRTPLTIIRGEIEVMLRKDRSKAEYKEILLSILEETHQMENIINDLMLLSQVRNVQKNIDMDTFYLDKQLLKIVDTFKPLVKEKSIKLNLGSIQSIKIQAKQTLIIRMITNVIDNALRYTPANGSITISLFEDKKTNNLSVTDTGIGIPDQALPFIFDRFYIVEKSRSKEMGGTGLGLSIVKWIADLHRVQIQVDSKIEKGTTFTFLFPKLEVK